MKIKLIISLLLLSIGILSAQTITKPKKTYKYIHPYNDTLWRKNEIGFGISAPGLSDAFVKKNKDIFDCNIQYKRLFTKSNAFRLGVNYYSESTGNDNTYVNPATLGSFNNLDTITTRATEYTSNKSAYINFGYEHFFGKKRIKFIIGSDIIVGFNKNTTQVLYNKYVTKVDTLINGMLIYSYKEINNSSNINGAYSSNGVSYQTYNTDFLIGLKPFIGLRANISNRLAFNFYTSFYLTYTDNFKSDITERRSNLNFDINGLVSEVSLFYRF